MKALNGAPFPNITNVSTTITNKTKKYHIKNEKLHLKGFLCLLLYLYRINHKTNMSAHRRAPPEFTCSSFWLILCYKVHVNMALQRLAAWDTGFPTKTFILFLNTFLFNSITIWVNSVYWVCSYWETLEI